MKIKAYFSLANLALAMSAMWLALSTLTAEAEETSAANHEIVAVLTRYDVKDGYQKQLREALLIYMNEALVNESNMMAEAYFEQDQSSVLWVIERWNSKSDFENASKWQSFKTIDSLSENGLSRASQRIYLTDLEPVSRRQWRSVADPADKPITIMLFVDAKPGTETRFKEVYHQAMPEFRSEPGVINYQLSQFADDSTRFVTYERFRSDEAFQYHLNFPPIQPVIDYLNTSIRKQPFQSGLHRLVLIPTSDQ
jgi:quinol monooxygenase YgiN